jgi:hypothetical protein
VVATETTALLEVEPPSMTQGCGDAAETRPRVLRLRNSSIQKAAQLFPPVACRYGRVSLRAKREAAVYAC